VQIFQAEMAAFISLEIVLVFSI